MTYKLSSQLSLIKAPVILVADGEEKSYTSGEELMALSFEKYYIIDSIMAKEDKVVVTLKENDRLFNVNWTGEEEVSFA